ncbi:MAG: alpha/beta fold hydrolase [Sphingomonadales bacterium]|nr:MAG: alpha/beta fold hydrolase [Sphingomonadales bacterium]
MARFVLVAGAWHGAWCWERIVPLLEARGHEVACPELPGMGADTTPLADVDLMVWARSVARTVEAQPGPAILAGHSRGGLVIGQVAELVPDRVALSVYLTAVMPADGETTMDILALVPEGTLIPPAMTPTDDGIAFIPDPQSMRDLLYQNTEAALVERALARLTPEPVFGFTSPLSLSEERFGRVPRAYIECLDDLTVPLVLQRAMHARQACVAVRSLDADHCPNYSAPEALAATLDELSALA